MPITTIAKMSTFGWDDFQAISSDEVKVKIEIPDGFVLDSKKSWVGVNINSPAGFHYGEFGLKEFEPPYFEEQNSFLTSKKVSIYSLEFDESWFQVITAISSRSEQIVSLPHK
ncbi:hypothetical protein [Microbulbifer celer]|uniref:Integron-associated effector binding protein domain-containing protein n=1 Tax=Microbulbifer celer TaxID=435905 RepID=A0ABW3UC97_9GAMM|nr:hypothetical protein [Microbulbifer celer]UFN56468.1 hypothetical protein LPW13_12915 [Microbulbifer celer]